MAEKSSDIKRPRLATDWEACETYGNSVGNWPAFEDSAEALSETVTTLAIAAVVLGFRARAAGPHGSDERAELCEKLIATLQPANDVAAATCTAPPHDAGCLLHHTNV